MILSILVKVKMLFKDVPECYMENMVLDLACLKCLAYMCAFAIYAFDGYRILGGTLLSLRIVEVVLHCIPGIQCCFSETLSM